MAATVPVCQTCGHRISRGNASGYCHDCIIAARKDPVVVINDNPSTLGILRLLAVAGDAGMQAGDLARHFNGTIRPERRNAFTNQTLHTLHKGGKVRRSDEKEPSLYYKNVPVWRWFITNDGRDYLRSGGREAVVRRRQEFRAESDRQFALRLQQRSNAILSGHAAARELPARCMTARAAFIAEMRAVPLTLDDIGRMLGITRERVRQIEAGKGVTPCRCDNCR